MSLDEEVSNIARLLAIGASIVPGGELPAEPIELPQGGSALKVLLQQTNGLFAFESALYVLGSYGKLEGVRDIVSWNEPELWRGEYKSLTSDVFFFAMDIFGGQFGLLKDGAVVALEPETGELRPMAPDLEAWAGVVLDDWDFVTGYTYARAWQQDNGALPMGQRLCPKVPFVFGGAYEAANLFACDAATAMRAYAYMAEQIRGLPDGARVRVQVVD